MSLIKLVDVSADTVSLEQGGVAQDALTYLTPEMFGAVGDGVSDDTAAVQATIDKLKTMASSTQIIGNGDYAISDSLRVHGFGSGCRMYLRSLRAASTWPSYSNWKAAKPLISIGGVGSMVGLNIECEYINGGNRADWINIVAQGCGGSHFHAERLVNVVCGVVPKDVTWPTASNKVTGGYWHDSRGTAFLLQRGTSGSSPIVEGWVFDINFIAGFDNGGIILRNGGQYANIRGQFDFNGRYLSECTVSSSVSDLTRGATITNGVDTAEVIAFYEHPLGSYKVLLAEGHDVSADGSLFSTSDTLTAEGSAWSSTIMGIQVPSVSNWYPDIIHDFTGSPFGKCIIVSPYCGGLVGGLLHSSVFLFGNSTVATTNGVNGAQWVHSGSDLSLRDVAYDNYALTFSANYMAPYRHLYMRNYRVYGSEVVVSLPRYAVTDIRTIQFSGDGTITSTEEVYRVTVSGALSGISGEALVYVNTAGIYLVNNTVTGVTLSTSGSTLQAAQGSQVSLLTMFNFQRIL
ncbi:putative structural protein [Pectobacterium phage PPWS1]|uniref:Structural protein n=1 Tax=Pectobacterium phage PPWS1 TaxID=1685500 RepID=A0A0P0UVV0_9CAUD|nr:tail spike protein [Pectobacterium phage PPWS1]BAS69569.1 putative structural protein [Pectobacterium phage PPWS1]